MSWVLWFGEDTLEDEACAFIQLSSRATPGCSMD